MLGGVPIRLGGALLLSDVVLGAVDASGFNVLLVGEGLAILLRQLAIILSAHAALFFIDARFLVLEACGFCRC